MKIFKKLSLIVLVALSLNAIEVVKVVNVYDGDTFKANLNCKEDIFCKNILVRVARIDTPELKGKCEVEKLNAIKAKEEVSNYFHNAKSIRLENIKRDKYFRILADIYIDDINLSNEMIKKDLAVPYEGLTKINWCK